MHRHCRSEEVTVLDSKSLRRMISASDLAPRSSEKSVNHQHETIPNRVATCKAQAYSQNSFNTFHFNTKLNEPQVPCTLNGSWLEEIVSLRIFPIPSSNRSEIRKCLQSRGVQMGAAGKNKINRASVHRLDLTRTF